MKAKRLLSLLLAAVLMGSVAVTPALAASAQLPAASVSVDEDNGPVSIRLTASGELVYGSPFELIVDTRPAETQ